LESSSTIYKKSYQFYTRFILSPEPKLVPLTKNQTGIGQI